MPEDSSAVGIDYVMEKASELHFSGLRFDSLRSSPSSSPRASSTATAPSVSMLSADSTTKQPFVIGELKCEYLPILGDFQIFGGKRFSMIKIFDFN